MPERSGKDRPTAADAPPASPPTQAGQPTPRAESAADDRPHVCVFSVHRTTDVRIFNRQILSLVRAGWRVTYIALAPAACDEVREGVRIIGLPRWEHRRQRGPTLRKIVRLALAQRADVYHFHDPELLLLGTWLRLRTGKPVVYDIHEFYAQKLPPQRVPALPGLRRLASLVISVVEWICARICGSVSAVYEYHRDLYARAGCRVVLTPNYASARDFPPPQLTDAQWAARADRVCFVGVLGPTKGSLLLVDVARRLRQVRPKVVLCMPHYFHVERQEREMFDHIRQQQAEGTIEWVPKANGDELAALIARHGIGISPLQDVGQYREAVPTKFFEYMSQGLAIVASDLPPSRRYVAAEGCGLLVPPADAEAYVRAICWLLDHPAEARRMGERGLVAFREKYNWEVYEPPFVRFYAGLCPSGKRRWLRAEG